MLVLDIYPADIEVRGSNHLAAKPRRSRAETTMHYVKLLGQRLSARGFDRLFAEFQVRVAFLNGFTALSTPITEGRRIDLS